MSDWRNAPGVIEPVIYFEAPKDFYVGTRLVKQGYVIVSPHTDHRTPEGYERKECRYLHEVDALTKKMNQQDQDQFGAMMGKDREIMRQRREKNRATLRQRMLAADCNAFERAFIKGALEYLDKKESESLNFVVRGFFTQREYDSASTDPIDNHGKQLQPPKMSDRLTALLGK
jgi:hypothetical protein